MASKTKISNKNQNAIFLMFRLLINIRNPIFYFTSTILAVENVKFPSGRHGGKAYVSSALFFKELRDSSETGIRNPKLARNAVLIAAIRILAQFSIIRLRGSQEADF
jgi:hypothetical protein